MRLRYEIKKSTDGQFFGRFVCVENGETIATTETHGDLRAAVAAFDSIAGAIIGGRWEIVEVES